MTAWIVILAVGAGSYALRSVPIALDLRWFRSPTFERAIGLVATSTLAALVATGLHRASSASGHSAAVGCAAGAALVAGGRGASQPKVLLAGAAAYAVLAVATALW